MQGKFLQNGNFSAAKRVASAASFAQFAKVVLGQIVMTPKSVRGFGETLLEMQNVRGEGKPHAVVGWCVDLDVVSAVLHICGKYIKKEDGRKERKQFGEDLFSRIARGWHGKC